MGLDFVSDDIRIVDGKKINIDSKRKGGKKIKIERDAKGNFLSKETTYADGSRRKFYRKRYGSCSYYFKSNKVPKAEAGVLKFS